MRSKFLLATLAIIPAATSLGQSLPVDGPGTLFITRRPQNPVKPYPYREEEVSYDNKTASITLAATLTIPAGKGPFPAVLLITGSGPQVATKA